LEYPHNPVMVNEVLEHLITLPEGIYVDGTVGSGGHSEAISKKLSHKGCLVCLDRDSEAIRLSKDRLSSLWEDISFVNRSYAEMDECLSDLEIDSVNGILLDLGMSSYQLDHSGRGFSFTRDEPLDMRMDPAGEITAQYLINNLSVKEIERVLREYGEEPKARLISRIIDTERKKKKINTSGHLADLIRSRVHVPKRYALAKDPATRTFQALRIAVNNELENLKTFLGKAPSLVAKGGRIVILSYHSLEDRIVKKTMAGWERGCTCPPDLPKCGCGNKPLFRRVFKKGIKPGKREIDDNPRARSAILRAAERI